MKLFFDARYIRTDFHDGISRFSTELAAAVEGRAAVTYLICEEAQARFLPKNAQLLKIHAPTSALEPFTALIINKHAPDIVFSPLQTIGSVGRKYKLIVTSHDMIYYHYRTPPTQLNPLLRAGWFLYHLGYAPQRLALNAADLVVTVSETTKCDFLKAKLTKRPIIVVPNAPRKLSGGSPEQGAPRSLIYMGSFMPYKNVEALIQAMRWLPEHTLHLLSRVSSEHRAQLEAIRPHGAKLVFHNGVSDEDYAALLLKHAVLVSASRYEGYGLPVAEALALGVPAVLTDSDIFREVAGEGALYADPDRPQEFARQILTLNDKDVRSALIKKGKKHIARYSWVDSADRLIKAAKSLL